jgi:predicted flap endonuclease-1-like 5' DNA nuclease
MTCYKSESIHRRINRKDRHKHQFDKDGDVVHSSDDDFLQTSDEDAQGNVITAEEQTLIMMNNSHRAPNKEDTKPAAKPEDENSPPSPEPNQRRRRKQEHEYDHMKKIFATLAENTQKQLREQGETHAMEIAAMKRANLDTHNMLTTKTMPAQTMNDHITTAHFTAMTKHSETLFDGTPYN